MRIAAVALAALALPAVACGGGADGTSGGGGTTAAATPPAAETRLSIDVWPNGPGKAGKRSWTLRCGPTGGTLPRPARACTALATQERPFAPVPKDVACTQIYGGPAEALVRGRYRGQAIWARFRRRDGCEIDRWERVRALFPVSVGAA